jgi:arylsulfatase A-like enzyme
MGPLHDPMTIDADPSRGDYKVAELALPAEVSLDRLGARRNLLDKLDRRLSRIGSASPTLVARDANQSRAYDLLLSSASQRGAFDLDEEPPALRERYGLNPHGQTVLQARRLVERGVPLVTVYWPNDGLENVSVYWDTHSRNFSDLKTRLMPVADQAFSALLDDLEARGLLDETLVVWTGEFGRTPRVGQRSSDAGAGRDGRDHWPGCFTTVLAGGGIKGGFVYGRSDKVAAYPAESPVAPADLVATVYHALGVPEDQIVHDATGRPQFVRPGKAIASLFA